MTLPSSESAPCLHTGKPWRTCPCAVAGAHPESAPSQVTAEERATRAHCRYIVDVWFKTNYKHDRREALTDLFFGLVSAAKREGAIEAHLQDARAGCAACKLGDKPFLYPASPGGLTELWLHHAGVAAGIEETFETIRDQPICKRPEVWDALSKLRKGGAEPDGGGR